ncbi:hypothetical protein [Pseudonocardia acidicola]|uniref:Uncharacterized protein n=1 Tax=Pseudonocardia acidicola TaxID=2724939 RepID=A0ABX1S4Y5_9PSEU|nr:hypothetical protein [Pseudonocardia acidicola]NMH96581.1 hypothetical protein [Pseudonocardia acidicola]
MAGIGWPQVAYQALCLAGPVLLPHNREPYRRLMWIISLLLVLLGMLTVLVLAVRVPMPDLPVPPQLPVSQLLL